MKKKISVIIPIYNVENYIEECIGSVMKQSLSELEILCVNDGTPDKSMEIVKRLASDDTRIVIINKENGGLSSARNAGMKEAKGEYICFLDGDDLLDEVALERLYLKAKDADVDDVFYTAKSFYENEALAEAHEIYKTYYDRKDSYEGVYTGQELFCKMITSKDFRPSACLQLLKREFVIKQGLQFYDGIVHEDQLFTLKAITLAKRTMYLDEAFYLRRVREASIMTQEKGMKNAYGYFISIKEMINFVSGNESILSEEFKASMIFRLKAMCVTAANFLDQTKEAQLQEDVERLAFKDQLLFELLIGNVWKQKKREKTAIKKEKDKLKQSWSYRMGDVITRIPRKVKKLFK